MKICCLTLLFIFTANVCCKAAPPVRPKQKSHHVRIYPINQNQYDALLKLTVGKRVINEGRLIDGGYTTALDGFNSFSKDVNSGWSSFLRIVGFTMTTYPENQVASKYDGKPLCAIRSTDINYNPKGQGREYLIDDDLEPLDDNQNVINCVVVLNRKPGDDDVDVDVDVDDDDDDNSDSNSNDDHAHHDHNQNHNNNKNQAPSSSLVYGYPYTLLPYIYIQKGEPITVTIQQSQQQNIEPALKETNVSEMEGQSATINVDKNNVKQTTDSTTTTISIQKEVVEEENNGMEDEQLEKTFMIPFTQNSDSGTTDKEVNTVRQFSSNNVPALNPNGYAQLPYGQGPYIPQLYVPHPQIPYGRPPYSQPLYGQPPYAQPPYGQPPFVQPPYDQPSFGQQPYGPPIYGQPPYGPQPLYGQRPYGPHPYPTNPYEQHGQLPYGPHVRGYPILYPYGSDDNNQQPRLNEDYDEDYSNRK